MGGWVGEGCGGGFHSRDGADQGVHFAIELGDGFGIGDGLIFDKRIADPGGPDLCGAAGGAKSHDQGGGDRLCFQVHCGAAQGFADGAQEFGISGDAGLRFFSGGQIGKELIGGLHFGVGVDGGVDRREFAAFRDAQGNAHRPGAQSDNAPGKRAQGASPLGTQRQIQGANENAGGNHSCIISEFTRNPPKARGERSPANSIPARIPPR